MRLLRLSTKDAEAEAARRGWPLVTNQNGVQRIEIDGAVIESGSTYTPLEFSIPAPTEKVKRFRLTTTVKTKAGDAEVIVGEFEHEHEAADYASETNLPMDNYKVSEVEAEV